jgi:citrate lyase subunit beta/citryl-CoA lyase
MTAPAEDWLVRSLMFVPAHAPSKLARALESEADALVLDLEDSVEPAAKAEARRLAAQFVAEHRPRRDRPRLYVRVNGLDSGLTQDDLAAMAPARPDGLMLPKPRSGACVSAFAQAVEAEERRISIPAGAVRIIAIATETPGSLLAMGSFVGCDPRLAGLAWGAEDLSAALGASAYRDEQGGFTAPYALARSLCLLAARAGRVPAIDGVYVDFRDLDGLDREAREAARDGFSAKLAIHPAQAPVINRAFTPSAEAVETAKAIVEAFAAQGDPGVISWRGRMLDRPHLEKAKQTLARTALFAGRSASG